MTTIISCLFIFILGVSSQNEIRAYFNMSNVQGYVEFTEESEDTTVAVFHLQTSGQFQWEIKQFPVLTTDGHTCDNLILGNRYLYQPH